MFSQDAASEAIAHFIGLFEIAQLSSRLRLDYDQSAAIPQDVDTGPVAMLDMTVPHPYMPRDFEPNMRYVPPVPDLDTVETVARYEYLPVRAPLPVMAIGPAPLANNTDNRVDLPDQMPPVTAWHLPAPGSVAVVIVQHGVLFDNDLFNADEFANAVDQHTLGAQLDTLAQVASTLGVASQLDLPAAEADFHTMAVQMSDMIAAGAGPDILPGAEVSSLSGADAFGQHLDGVSGATRPDIDDLLPAAWRDVHPRASDPETEGPAHQVVHGANMLLNEVTLTASWISAPVLAVAGSSYAFDLISQVNVWQDIDTVSGIVHGLAGGATQGFNFATLTHAAAPLPVVEHADAAGPAFWVTTTIEGSLINFNWIEQHNFVSDNDVTSITLQGSQTTLVFGANQASNQISLLELGARFDLIVVDGHLINLSAILQTNVLLDSDNVILRDGANLSSGDNLLLNDATIHQVGQANHVALTGGFAKLFADGTDDVSADVRNDPAFAGLDVVRVLHIKGNLVSAQIIEQVNILGDADQVDLLAARAMENAGDVSVITGSNVLINAAHIGQFGVDSTVHTGGGVYSDALIHQAQLVDSNNPFAAAGGLASEAVVFLTDDMIGAGGLDGPSFGAAHVAGDIYSPDPMHTVVA